MRFLNLLTEIPDEFVNAFFRSWKIKVVICETPAEAESVLLCFDRCGYRWKTGTPYTEAPKPPLTWEKEEKSLNQFLHDHFSFFNNICFSNNGTWGPLSLFPGARLAKDGCIKVSDISADLISRMLGEE